MGPLLQGHDDYRDLFTKYAAKQLALDYTNQTFGWPRLRRVRQQEGSSRGMAVGYTRGALATLQGLGRGKSRLRGQAQASNGIDVEEGQEDDDEEGDDDVSGGPDGDDDERRREKRKQRRARQRRRQASGKQESVVDTVTKDLVQLIREANDEDEDK